MSPIGALLDTARVYQVASGDGDTESTLGQTFASFPSLQRKMSVATKANAMVAPHKSLSKESVIEQCHTSLEKLGIDCVDLFYLHSPDIKTDIEDTLSGIEQLHEEGKIKEFGLSNYPAWAVVDIWHRCKNRGMVRPTVYQGMYNVITRDMEREIVPVAREFGLRLYMYNPLAGGLLSGRYGRVEDLAEATEGRFSAEFDQAFGGTFKAGTQLYRARYSKQPFFDALEILRKACAPETTASGAGKAPTLVEESDNTVDGVRVRVQVHEVDSKPQGGLDLPGVALRWLIHHSCLTTGDGIIIGVSKQNHLVANLAAWQAGPLPDHIAAACDAAWEAARPACESYFRGYGARPGGIEGFLALKAARREEEEGEAAAKRARAS
uniref:NADP-dependent oxidoreductase domain-containing protein n=1 Tax=Alexandrium monilatum TaxID=311494 RepID=A0A7S4WC40_9DINO